MVASWLDDHMFIQDNIDEYVSMQSQPITVVLLQIAPPHVTSSHTPFKAVQELFSGMSSLSGIRHCVGNGVSLSVCFCILISFSVDLANTQML